MMDPVRLLLATPREQRDTQWLQKALQNAVELEFSTVPPYLYAYWSIREGSYAKESLREIFIEEMLHMTLAANLLASVGGRPLFIDAAAPVYPGFLKAGVHANLFLGLQALDKTALKNFMIIEEPDVIPPNAGGPDFQKTGDKTIGQFYEAILQALEGAEPPFVFDIAAQLEVADEFVISDTLGRLTSTVVHNLAAARQAVELILRQGEGTSAEPFEAADDLAHFYSFAELYYGRKLTRDSGGFYSYSGEVLAPIDLYPGVALDENASLGFNQSYSEMLRTLQRAWDERAPNLVGSAIGSMFGLSATAKSLMMAGTGPTFRYVD